MVDQYLDDLNKLSEQKRSSDEAEERYNAHITKFEDLIYDVSRDSSEV